MSLLPTPTPASPSEQSSQVPAVPTPVSSGTDAPKPASYQLPPMPATPPPAPIGFVKPMVFPPMKDRLHRTVNRFRASLGTFMCIGIAAVLPSALNAALRGQLPIAAVVGLAVLSVLLSLLTPYMVVAVAAGELNFGKAAVRGFQSILPGIISAILAALALVLPSVLMIPAIILSIRFMLVMNVIVNERRKGIDALARSRDLVFGRTATLFFDQLGLSLLFGIATLAVSGLVGVATWALRPSLAVVATSAAAAICVALFYPFYIIYLQTFYEDCVAIVGKEWTVTPSRKLLYRILAVLGALSFIGMISLPIFFLTRSKLSLSDFGKLNISTPFGDQQAKETSVTPVVAPPTYSSTPDQRDLQRYGDVNTVKLALGSWFNDSKTYPDALDQLAPKYLKAIPKDPDGSAYGYKKNDLTYVVSFTLEQGVLAFAKGPHTLTANGFDVAPQATVIPPDDKTSTTTIPAPAPAPAPPTPSPLPPEPIQPPSATAPPDADGDGLTDEQEIVYGTNPAVADTDGDGLSDGEEVYVYGTNPLLADTDGDGHNDGEELQKGYNPKGPGTLTAEQKAQFDANLQTFHAKK